MISSQSKILFSGYYGMQNVGDDCFCVVANWGAHKFWGTDNVSFLCDRLPRLPYFAAARLSSAQKFRGENKLRLVSGVLRHHLIVFAGGSIFHGHEGWERQWIYRANRFFKVPMGAIGVSLGPYRSSREHKLVIEMLRRLSFLILRDQRSYEEAVTLNLPYQPVLGFDLAALLPNIYTLPQNQNSDTESSRMILGVVPCHYERFGNANMQNEERREREFLHTLKLAAQKIPLLIKLFEFNSNQSSGDTEYINELSEALKDDCRVEKIMYRDNPESIWREIHKCDSVLSIRLHGGILACMAGVPFLQVEYHQKCTDFLDEIHFPLEFRIGDMDVWADFAAELLISMLVKKNVANIDREQLTNKALLNFNVPINMP